MDLKAIMQSQEPIAIGVCCSGIDSIDKRISNAIIVFSCFGNPSPFDGYGRKGDGLTKLSCTLFRI